MKATIKKNPKPLLGRKYANPRKKAYWHIMALVIVLAIVAYY